MVAVVAANGEGFPLLRERSVRRELDAVPDNTSRDVYTIRRYMLVNKSCSKQLFFKRITAGSSSFHFATSSGYL